MVGALTKTYYAEKKGIDPPSIFVVSIMPCTAKKFEITAQRGDVRSSGQQDIDVSLTTRELCPHDQERGHRLPEPARRGRVDSLLGDYTGAGTIFGVTGGVMEAALRTATTGR